MTWEQALAGWATWMRSGRRSELTIRQWTWCLRLAGQQIGADPWKVTGEQLVTFAASRGWGAGSARQFRSAARSFWSWACETGRTDRNPALALPKIRVDAGLPRPAGDDALARVLDGATDKNRLMVLLASLGGLRCAEIAALRWADVEPDALRVTGKGRKLRRVPLHPDLAAELAAERARRDSGSHGTGWRYVRDGGRWVFPGQSGGPMAARWVSQQLSAQLGPGTTAHMLRHRFASRAYAAERDLLAVQRLLGHSSPTVTVVYAQVADESLLRAVLAAGGGTA